MNALERPLGIGYGYTGSPYSPAYPHRGVDIKAWTGDPIIVGDTTIGYAGSTGKADGPHVHVQAGYDEWAQKTIDPTPYIGVPGTVVKVGSASEWGIYVCIKVGDVYVYYCHMSARTVTVGTVIVKEVTDMPLTPEQQDKAIKMGLRREPRADELTNPDWRNNPGLLIDTLWGNGGSDLYYATKADPDKTDAEKKLQAIKDALGIK